MDNKNIESYLRKHLEQGIIDFAIRARVRSDGMVVFYIHPQGKDGDTYDYEVHEDQLFNLNDGTPLKQ